MEEEKVVEGATEIVEEPIEEPVEEQEEEKPVDTGFDFDEAYEKLLEGAKATGMYDDIGFQTLMREFKNLNTLCIRMKEDIDDSNISDVTEGSKGQLTWKSNPVIKDYNTTVKNLVLVCNALEKKLANVSTNEDDWL